MTNPYRMLRNREGMMQRSAAEAHAEFERHLRDIRYFEQHYNDLLNQYPEQWVAIFNQQVVGNDLDYEVLLTRLKQEGYPLGQIFCEFLTREQVDLIVAEIA